MPLAALYRTLPTEQPNPRSRSLDRLTPAQILRLMNREDANVPRAVAAAIPSINAAVSLIVTSLRTGGRLVFLGAGTSGRLGVLEAAECPPTFNTPPTLVQAIIAGGRRAVFRSQEGAEDDASAARRVVRQRVRAKDVVVGIAASGVTPFVAAGLRTAKTAGASTVLVTGHSSGEAGSHADVLITPRVGPELLTGSTRLKAGTATKLILNMLTVASMVQLGKVYGNWMVDVRPTSRKLTDRAVRIIQSAARVSQQDARRALRASRGQVKLAIVMAVRRADARTARRLLAAHHGHLRPILHG